VPGNFFLMGFFCFLKRLLKVILGSSLGLREENWKTVELTYPLEIIFSCSWSLAVKSSEQ